MGLRIVKEGGANPARPPVPADKTSVYLGPVRIQCAGDAIYIAAIGESPEVNSALQSIASLKEKLDATSTPHEVYTRRDCGDPAKDIPDTIVLKIG